MENVRQTCWTETEGLVKGHNMYEEIGLPKENGKHYDFKQDQDVVIFRYGFAFRVLRIKPRTSSMQALNYQVTPFSLSQASETLSLKKKKKLEAF